MDNIFQPLQAEEGTVPLSRVGRTSGPPMDFSFADIMRAFLPGYGIDPKSEQGNALRKLVRQQAYDIGMSLGPSAIAYHGSPHLFDKFDMNKIGTGEGAQAYGHGLYFAENPQVAKSYSGILSDGVYSSRVRSSGQLYKVDLPDEAIGKMLDWDKPLSAQPSSVIEGIKKAGLWPGDGAANLLKGGEFYNRMAMYQKLGDEFGKQAYSKALKEAGVTGIKYLDQGSRSAGKGTYNYVVFDENLPKIIGKE